MSGAFVSLPSHSARAFPFNVQRILVKAEMQIFMGCFFDWCYAHAARYTDMETRQAVPLAGNIGPCGSLE